MTQEKALSWHRSCQAWLFDRDEMGVQRQGGSKSAHPGARAGVRASRS